MNTNRSNVVWLNGRLTPIADASVSALDRGMTWGWGLFETMRAYERRIWGLEAHFERMAQGAQILDLEIPPLGVWRSATQELFEANGLTDAGVRVTVTGGQGAVDPHEVVATEPTRLITAWPVADMTALYADGVSLVTVDWGRPLPTVKSTSYAPSVAGRIAAKRAGADDALFVDGDRVLETTGSNLFAVNGRTLATPPVVGKILEGVTRRTLIDAASDAGWNIQERDVTVSDLAEADEVILSASVREIYRVRRMNNSVLGNVGAAPELHATYRAWVTARL